MLNVNQKTCIFSQKTYTTAARFFLYFWLRFTAKSAKAIEAAKAKKQRAKSKQKAKMRFYLVVFLFFWYYRVAIKPPKSLVVA